MDWIFLLSAWDRNSALESNGNWTKPFFSNVIQKFNNSLAGPQRMLNNHASYQDPLTEQTLIMLPLLIILFCKQFLNKDSSSVKNTILLSWPRFINPKIIFHIVSYIIFLIIFPILSCMLIFSFINRQIVKTILKLKHGETFVKLLDGTDAIWAVEEDKAKSIINVIATVQVTNANNSNANGDLLQKLRYIVKDKFLSRRTPYPKMLYRRSCEMGYYYWEENDKIAIEDFIRPMICDSGVLSKQDLNKIVSELSNSDLPHNNTATWEILVGQNPMKDSSDDVRYYPLMFRIHHSLGDGVVLMKLLMKAIADEGKTNIKRQMSIVIPIDDFKTTVKQLFCLSNINKIKDGIIKIFKTTCRVVSVLSMVPTSLVGQLTRPPDDNILHGKALEGVKVCAWIKESDIGEGILKKMKNIKNRINGSTFSDLFLTALSASYHKYFSQHPAMGKTTVPNEITAIVPVRVEQSDLNLKQEIKDSSLKLENRFTVAMLPIPIKIRDKTDSTNVTHMKRLLEIKKQTTNLRNSADFYVNYFIMSLAGHVFPKFILCPMLKSEQASLVISNLPGPSNITICGGNSIKDMAFFVPHRGTTGMGVTLLSYNGRVNLGLMADKAVLSSAKDAEDILKGALRELDMLDVITSKL